MSTHPVELGRTDDQHLEILWSDGSRQRISYRTLRDRCPCATCREAKVEEPQGSGLRVLSAAETQPLAITSMRPVGNYAYNIHFSCGHNTGIFTFDLIRSLSEPL